MAIVRTEGPEVAQTLWSLAWVLWGFGAFAVADIFMRRQLEIERLVGAIAKQERLATLGRLASLIAHQSRHHLGILNMSAYVLDETLAKETLSLRGREAVARELEAIERTRDELDQLLTQELRSGSHEQTFGLMALARECGADLTPLARTRGVTLSYVGDEQRIRGDRLRLKQAITNVLRNAIEAAPAESNVSVELATADSEVHLSVRDQGPGLSLSARSHLFEPLFTEKMEGLGMGLYVAHAIVEAHGGSLALVDTGRGTQAEIHLVREAPHPA